MKLTRVEAESYQEALRKIRRTLGDDAMIVGTRTLRRGGMLGLGGREVVEVYVTDPRPSGIGQEAGAPEAGRSGGPGQAPRLEKEAREEIQSLSRALGQLQHEVRELAQEKDGVPGHLFLHDALALLLERGVEPKLAARIVGQLRSLPLPEGVPDAGRVQAVVAVQLRKLFLPNVPLPVASVPRVVALVGPTGVGKTTTVAKLAARVKLGGSPRVALITLDTFRIAARDQLQKYAEIIGTPLRVASDPVELRAGVAALRKEGMETVFIDSAGQSQRDELKMTELKGFLEELPGAEAHLVLSATTHPQTLRSVAERFREVGFQRVILTKLDEAACFGPMLEVLVAIGKPVSYLTDGQNVPDDLMPSDPERLADLVLRPRES